MRFAHGQMTENQLENVLFPVYWRRITIVLVTTTIIETGVDIPNVNTLFVGKLRSHGDYRQLYQLMRPCGRLANRVAYAYLCIKRIKF